MLASKKEQVRSAWALRNSTRLSAEPPVISCFRLLLLDFAARAHGSARSPLRRNAVHCARERFSLI
jgi:hypothetical protein